MKHCLTLSFFILISIKSISCVCHGYNNIFCESVDTAKVDLIAFGKITQIVDYGIKLQIINSFYGTENEDTITVWGDPGLLCRTYLGNHVEGEYLILAINEIGSQGRYDTNEKPGHYDINGCGTFILGFKENGANLFDTTTVYTEYAFIYNSTKQMPFNEFKAIVLSNTCTGKILEINSPIKKEKLIVSPNPTNSFIDIKINTGLISNVEIINYNGVIVKFIDHPNRNSTRIYLDKIPSGLYLIKTETDKGKTLTQRVIIE